MTGRGRRAEGPLLALTMLGLLVGLGAVVAGLAFGSEALRGVCLLILGAGVLAARREIAEVWMGLNAGPPRGDWVDSSFRAIVSLIGAGLAVAGAVVLGQAAL